MVPLVDLIASHVSAKSAGFGAELAEAAEEDVESYLRSLQELLKVEAWLHERVAMYVEDIDRHDLPVGLLYLVDHVVLGLLGPDFDPLIHKHAKRTYSTDSLWHDALPLMSGREEEYEAARKPVVFNLPTLDAGNALLSPILVHEATHTYLRTSPLRREFFAAIPREAIQQHTEDYRTATGSQWPEKVFENWIGEVLCDCVAVLATGPSFLFAISALSGSFDAEPSSQTHPFMATRVQIMLSHLRATGWLEVLDERSPIMRPYFESLSNPAAPSVDPVAATLSAQLLECTDVLLEVCRPHVVHGLTRDLYESVAEPIENCIRSGIPPVEVDGEPPSPWSIVLGAWMVKMGGSSVDLPDAVGDKALSLFTMKSIELAAILELWREDIARS